MSLVILKESDDLFLPRRIEERLNKTSDHLLKRMVTEFTCSAKVNVFIKDLDKFIKGTLGANAVEGYINNEMVWYIPRCILKVKNSDVKTGMNYGTYYTWIFWNKQKQYWEVHTKFSNWNWMKRNIKN